VLDLEQRLAECRRRWEAAPLSRAFIPLADALRQAGRCDEALAVLEQGLAAHPGAVGGLVTLARTHVAAGRPQQAAFVAARILEHDPDNLVALEILGQEERRRGHIAAAIACFERLAGLDPADRHWAEVLAALRREVEAPAAAPAPEEAETGFATLTLAELYLAQGYRHKAAATLRRLAAERPHDAQLAVRLAELEAAADGPAVRPASPAPQLAATQMTAPQTTAPAAGRPAAPPPPATRRQQSQEQFALWIERLRADRGAPR
jgi:tetratricopeptide (TPR) repeat protein